MRSWTWSSFSHFMTTPVRIPELIAKKARSEKISILTAYDATMARLLDQTGVDALLVGDSLGMVILGEETTIPVTMEMMIYHTRAVSKGARRALVITDLPFLSYHVSAEEALRNAGRLIQEGGAAAVKMEGGAPVAAATARIVDAGIPVMGHIGLTPQSVHRLGGYRQTGKTEAEARQLLEDAQTLARAGVFALVLECIPAEVARTITAALTIPTIGIGSGPYCDGQVLVSYDAFGLYPSVPSFVKQYAQLGQTLVAAAKEYVDDVREGRYPACPRS
jgi:3-methyl-2-oxobutanoate hydroxymethyltransferase